MLTLNNGYCVVDCINKFFNMWHTEPFGALDTVRHILTGIAKHLA